MKPTNGSPTVVRRKTAHVSALYIERGALSRPAPRWNAVYASAPAAQNCKQDDRTMLPYLWTLLTPHQTPASPTLAPSLKGESSIASTACGMMVLQYRFFSLNGTLVTSPSYTASSRPLRPGGPCSLNRFHAPCGVLRQPACLCRSRDRDSFAGCTPFLGAIWGARRMRRVGENWV